MVEELPTGRALDAALADALQLNCRYTISPDGEIRYDGDGFEVPPCWHADLNAGHALETELARRGLHLAYAAALRRFQGPSASSNPHEWMWEILHAGAELRAQAALVVLREAAGTAP